MLDLQNISSLIRFSDEIGKGSHDRNGNNSDRNEFVTYFDLHAETLAYSQSVPISSALNQ